MSLLEQVIPKSLKFTPASQEVNWTRVNTLVHGPGAWDSDKRTVNSAVFACLMAIAKSYPEPPLTVFRKLAEGKDETLPDHPLQQILEQPTQQGELSIYELLFWTAWAKNLDGNAYWIKERSGDGVRGNVINLWPVSPTVMAPATEKNSGDWVSFYKYRIAPNQTVEIPVENVVHFRLGLDDTDMRRGLSPFKALVRQITTDEEADRFVAALLKNYAVPGLVVTPTGDGSILPDDAEKMEESLRRKYGNDNRGNIAVIGKSSNIQQFGFSPKDLDMSMLHRIPEERISAAFGVPAIVAGLGAGLDRATYSNSRELGEWFTERTLVPQWNADAAKLNASLRPDFTSDGDIFVAHDMTNIRALQEDMDAKYSRLYRAVGMVAFMKRNEARTEVGLDPIEGWDDEDTAPPQMPPQFGQEGQPDQSDREDDQQAEELRTWRRWAIKQVENGGIKRDFETNHVPPSLAGAIAGALDGARSVKDVERVFDDLEWMGYP